MHLISVVSYAAALILYIVFTISMFPVLRISCAIPVIPLFALGAWLFGRRIGYYLILAGIFYHCYLTSILYADLLDVYEYKLAGFVVLVIVVSLMGSLKNNYAAIKATNRHLDQMVETRTEQLQELTSELLRNAEKQRVLRGQELHDGMGQQLTGIQLLTASLHEALKEERNHLAGQVATLLDSARTTHQKIRNISRMFFPVQIDSVGLIPALNEMAGNLQSIKPVTVKVSVFTDMKTLSESTSLQLFRICQETALYLVDQLKADFIHISTLDRNDCYAVELCHRARVDESNVDSLPGTKLTMYRLTRISGGIEFARLDSGLKRIRINIPKSSVLV